MTTLPTTSFFTEGTKDGRSARPTTNAPIRTTRSQPTKTSAELSDSDLAIHIAQARQGNETSFAALLLYLKPYIDKILNTRLRCHQAKEDTNQDIHIKIYRKLGQYSGKVPLKNWVSRIAVNACTDTYNRKTRRTEIGFGELSEEQVRYIETVKACNKSDLRESRYAAQEVVTQHLPRLRSADQLIIRLLYLEGLSHREISQRTGWTETLSKVRAYRARKKLLRSIQSAEAENTARRMARPNPDQIEPA